MTSSSAERPAQSHRDTSPDESASSSGHHLRADHADHHDHDREVEDEQSPLLSSAGSDEFFIDHQHGHLHGEEDKVSVPKSLWGLMLLTISIGGLQLAWSVEISNGSPYLLSLGLSKSLMALVWIAGPLSGTLVQPYVGMLSDRCRIPWGKRKPFMLGGAAATMASLMLLSWAKEIVSGILGLFGADPASEGVKVTVIVVAVLFVYILDFAINTVQAAIRAFIVDCAPAHQQEAANSMASRIIGVGNIIGYVAGYVDLPNILGWLGRTQFQILCAIASIGLGSTVCLSCAMIPERDPRLEGPPPKDEPGILSFFVRIFKSIKRLPPQTRKVCAVQFCAWVGFFPMLFYTSSYIGEIYINPILEENPNMSPEELDKLYEKATRVGTFALLIFAITSLTTNVLLPFFIAPTFDTQPINAAAGPMEAPAIIKDYEPKQKKKWQDILVMPGLTLRRAWFISLLIFSASMFCTVLVSTVAAATVLIGLVGITWALTLWAPFAIISAEISRRDAIIRARRRGPRGGRGGEQSLPSDNDAALNLTTLDDQDQGDDDEEEEHADQAGVILGIHNMAIAAPQIIATVGSSIIFKIFQKPRGTPGDHSIAMVMALGGITVLGAAYIVTRIEDTPAPPVDGDGLSAMEQGDNDTTLGGIMTPSREPPSLEQSARKSLDRATMVRQNSFGGGLEY